MKYLKEIPVDVSDLPELVRVDGVFYKPLEPLAEARFTERLHRRNRRGEFMDKPDVTKLITNPNMLARVLLRSSTKLNVGQSISLEELIRDHPRIRFAAITRTSKNNRELNVLTEGGYAFRMKLAAPTGPELMGLLDLIDADVARSHPDHMVCMCGCGNAVNEKAKSRYLPGHDARHKANLTRAARAGSKEALEILQAHAWASKSATPTPEGVTSLPLEGFVDSPTLRNLTMPDLRTESIRRAQAIGKELDEVFGRPSAWKGEMLIQKMGGNEIGMKGWQCYIQVDTTAARTNNNYPVLLHEMLHSYSIHRKDRRGYNMFNAAEDYKRLQGWEEGVVEQTQRLFRKPLAEKMGLSYDEADMQRRDSVHAYNVYIRQLEVLREMAKMDREAFYLGLMNTHLSERPGQVWDWIQQTQAGSSAATLKRFRMAFAILSDKKEKFKP